MNYKIDTMPDPSVFTVIKDIVVTIIAAVGAGVALRGVSTWKRQLRANRDFEIGDELLRAGYKLLMATIRLRDGGDILEHVVASASQANPPTIDMGFINEVLGAVHQESSDEFSGAITDLHAIMNRAAVSWGISFTTQFEDLNAVIARRRVFEEPWYNLYGRIGEELASKVRHLRTVGPPLKESDTRQSVAKEIHDFVETLEVLVRKRWSLHAPGRSGISRFIR